MCNAEPCRQEKIDFWDDVYGFDMSRIKAMAMLEPLVDNVDPEQIASHPSTVKTIDILTMTKEDATFSVSAALVACCSECISSFCGSVVSVISRDTWKLRPCGRHAVQQQHVLRRDFLFCSHPSS